MDEIYVSRKTLYKKDDYFKINVLNDIYNDVEFRLLSLHIKGDINTTLSLRNTYNDIYIYGYGDILKITDNIEGCIMFVPDHIWEINVDFVEITYTFQRRNEDEIIKYIKRKNIIGSGTYVENISYNVVHDTSNISMTRYIFPGCYPEQAEIDIDNKEINPSCCVIL